MGQLTGAEDSMCHVYCLGSENDIPNMYPVPLMFSRGVPGKIDGIKSCMPINVILHASFVENPYRSFTRQFYQTDEPPDHRCSHYNSTKPESRFKQIKYNLGSVGKIQQYYPGRNLIRAGKHSHADAVATTLKFLKWAGERVR